MPNIKNASATGALNEDQYINKLYDNVIDKQKDLLKDNQNAAATELDALKESVQQQTNTNLGRVNVETQRLQQAYKAPNTSSSVQQQIALAMDNQKKKNVTAMRTVQSEADAEIDRQRKLLGEQYAAAIKKAQADNDMVRAQQLYEAAKQEDAQLLSLKKQAGNQLAAVGDNSILDSLMAGNAVARDTTGETWEDVRKNEQQLNKVYDSAIESERQEAQMALNEALSKIEAAQAAEVASTDRNLTQTYINALKRNRNYNEVQNAYGLGSGNLAQARLAQALGLTEDLTDQRGVLADNAAARGQQRFSAGQSLRDALLSSLTANEQRRAQALYDAAEAEEQTLVDTQKSVGNALAQQGDYSVLGKLYGLTQDQIDRLQGTGAYAPKEETTSSGSGGGSSGGGGRGGSGNGAADEDDSFEPAEDTPASNDEKLALGRGPISDQELTSLVKNGEVASVKTESGYKLVNVNPNTGLPTQNGKPASKSEEATRKAVTSGSAVVKETFLDKVANKAEAALTPVGKAIIQAQSTPAEEPIAAAGKAIGTAIVNAIKNGSKSSNKVDAVSSAAPKATKSTSTKSTSTKSKTTQTLTNAIKQAALTPAEEPAAAAGKAIGTAIANAIKNLVKKKK